MLAQPSEHCVMLTPNSSHPCVHHSLCLTAGPTTCGGTATAPGRSHKPYAQQAELVSWLRRGSGQGMVRLLLVTSTTS